MDYQTDLTKFKERVNASQDILIVTHEHPTFDSIGSSLALSLALQSLGKNVAVACSETMTVELSHFIGVNKIINTIGKKNFVISLDYAEGSIEKVSYNIEGNKFNLVIEPRAGHPPFSEENVSYTRSGVTADTIIAVDTIHLGGLGKVYETEKELFKKSQLISIDRHPNNAEYADINIIDPSSPSTAQIVADCILALGVVLSEDMATNLLNALYWSTDSFESTLVTAKTFEVAASCRRANGRKFDILREEKRIIESKINPQTKEPRSVPKQEVLTKSEVKQEEKPKHEQQAPEDWLKPKIFKSSNPV